MRGAVSVGVRRRLAVGMANVATPESWSSHGPALVALTTSSMRAVGHQSAARRRPSGARRSESDAADAAAAPSLSAALGGTRTTSAAASPALRPRLTLSSPSAPSQSHDPPIQRRAHESDDRGETELTPMEPQEALDAIVKTFQNAVPGPTPEHLGQLLLEARQPRELRRIVRELVVPHPLFRDIFNGHGFRVHVFSKMLLAATRMGELDIIFEFMAPLRQLGFVMSRMFAAAILESMKVNMLQRFQKEGRNPEIITSVLGRCRELRQICREDHIPYDFVMHTRELYTAAGLLGIFDRQNLYRANFPPTEVPRREGLVVDWVVSHIERVPDYDFAVLETRKFVRETLDRVADANVMPSFSFMTRLADFYFAADDVYGMLSSIEDCHTHGIAVAESTYAKAMQLACAFNLQEVPELQLKLRAIPPQCILATPDVSRLLGYYARAGGGMPCPSCGEPFNHRNPHIDVWRRTTEAMRQCPKLHNARLRRGVLEDDVELPQNADHGEVAFDLWNVSQQSAVQWGAMEWKFFLLCIIFSPRAEEGIALLEAELPRDRWDEFLSAQYVRALRFNNPERIVPVLQQWKRDGVHLSPLSLQQAAMGQLMVVEPKERVEGLEQLAEWHVDRNVYTMRYAARLMAAHRQQLLESAVDRNDPLVQREVAALEALSTLAPKSIKASDVKDSASDVLAVNSHRHRIYPDIPEPTAR